LKINKRVLDISNSTHSVRKRMDKTIELANKFVIDPDRNIRLKECECPVCYYIDSRIGGAMMTDIQCALCDEIMHFSSTSVDILCHSCASKNNLCKHCGSDVNVKKRRS